MLPFHDDILILVVSPEHPLAGKNNITLQEIADQKFIGFEPDIPTRKATDQIFKDEVIEMEPVM